MTDDAADSTRDDPAADLEMAADAMTEADQQAIDELAAAEADYAAGNTISGEEVRRRYGLPNLKSTEKAVDAHVAAGEVTVHADGDAFLDHLDKLDAQENDVEKQVEMRSVMRSADNATMDAYRAETAEWEALDADLDEGGS
jgi:hypothetical protein